MNRNVESHFSELPSANIQRSIFDRSSGHKTSFNAGELIPVYIDEVLPGDTMSIVSSKVLRLQTLLTPIYDNMYLDTYWFYAPNRILWDHWKEFCGENNTSAWAPETTYSIPKIKSPENGWSSGTIADYLGLPVGVEMRSGDHLPSALPFRFYAKCANEFFRDENLTDPLNISTGDATQEGSNGDDFIDDVANGGKPFKVSKYHDYFTSCLPAPQKGTSPQIAVGADYKGEALRVYASKSRMNSNTQAEKYQVDGVWDPERAMHFTLVNTLTDPQVVNRPFRLGEQTETTNAAYYSGDGILAYPTNLEVMTKDQKLSGEAIDINQLRLAFATQKFLERNARGGSRYAEILLSHFGVRAPDASLQRPEYLGGNRVPLQIHQITNQAQGEQDFLGDLGAMSCTADVHADFQKSFTEHGYIMCLVCVRYDHTYSQGIERFWLRDSFTDFYLPVFANLGEQPVWSDEIYYDQTNSDDVFGYQECWADYRYKPSRTSAELRPGIPNSLAYWHLGDYYTELPTLSDGWIREDKSNVDRVLAVTSTNANQIFADFYFKCTATRPMPMYSIPGLIDHN